MDFNNQCFEVITVCIPPIMGNAVSAVFGILICKGENKMSDFCINTERLTIRKFRATDWEDLSEILTDENVVYFEPYDVFTVEACKSEAENFSNSDKFFAVVLKDEDKVIGKLYFNDEGKYGTYELGYTFSRSYQGHGYAKEGSMALIKYAFENMGARRIVAFADAANERSWRLLEALGMSNEGKMKKYTFKYKDENGEPIWQDMLIYALLKEDVLENK